MKVPPVLHVIAHVTGMHYTDSRSPLRVMHAEPRLPSARQHRMLQLPTSSGMVHWERTIQDLPLGQPFHVNTAVHILSELESGCVCRTQQVSNLLLVQLQV